jgi:hypothetical protein
MYEKYEAMTGRLIELTQTLADRDKEVSSLQTLNCEQAKSLKTLS